MKGRNGKTRWFVATVLFAAAQLAWTAQFTWIAQPARAASASFNIMEASIEDIHKAFKEGTLTVPAGFTAEGLPVGITFFGPSFSEPTLIKLAYSYEQATHHRIPPKTTPALMSKK